MRRRDCLEKRVAIFTLFVSFVCGVSSDNCILLGNNEVRIEWNFGDVQYRIFINNSEVKNENFISNQHLCIESEPCVESELCAETEIKFIVQNSRFETINSHEPLDYADKCGNLLTKLNAIKISNFLPHTSDKKREKNRSKKSLSYQKGQKKKRDRTFTEREIRLAKQFLKRLKRLDKKQKVHSRRKNSRKDSYKRKYSKIESWVKRKHPRNKTKIQKRNAREDILKETTRSAHTTLIPGQAREKNSTKIFSRKNDCSSSQFICFSDSINTVNITDLFNCVSSPPNKYYISLVKGTHMSNITILYNPVSKSQKFKSFTTKILSTPSEKKPSDIFSPPLGLQYNVIILIIISTTCFLVSILLVAFCVHALKLKQRKMNNRHKSDCCQAHDFESMCQRCPLSCDSQYNAEAAAPIAQETSKSTCNHHRNKITHNRDECSKCKLNREQQQHSNTLCGRHNNVGQLHCNICDKELNSANARLFSGSGAQSENQPRLDFKSCGENHKVLSVAMHKVPDSSRRPVQNQIPTSFYPAHFRTPSCARRHHQFPDGEEFNNPSLQKLFEDGLMTPDYINISCKYRPPPNRTLFQSEAIPPTGSNDASRSRNSRHNKLISYKKESTKNTFAQSKKKPNKKHNNNEGKTTHACRCNEHSHTDLMTNNNLGAFNGEPPPLYSDIANEGLERSPTKSDHHK